MHRQASSHLGDRAHGKPAFYLIKANDLPAILDKDIRGLPRQVHQAAQIGLRQRQEVARPGKGGADDKCIHPDLPNGCLQHQRMQNLTIAS